MKHSDHTVNCKSYASEHSVDPTMDWIWRSSLSRGQSFSLPLEFLGKAEVIMYARILENIVHCLQTKDNKNDQSPLDPAKVINVNENVQKNTGRAERNFLKQQEMTIPRKRLQKCSYCQERHVWGRLRCKGFQHRCSNCGVFNHLESACWFKLIDQPKTVEHLQNNAGNDDLASDSKLDEEVSESKSKSDEKDSAVSCEKPYEHNAQEISDTRPKDVPLRNSILEFNATAANCAEAFKYFNTNVDIIAVTETQLMKSGEKEKHLNEGKDDIIKKFIENTDATDLKRQLEDLKLDWYWFSRTEEMDGKSLKKKKRGFFNFTNEEIEQLITSCSCNEEVEELIRKLESELFPKEKEKHPWEEKGC